MDQYFSDLIANLFQIFSSIYLSKCWKKNRILDLLNTWPISSWCNIHSTIFLTHDRHQLNLFRQSVEYLVGGKGRGDSRGISVSFATIKLQILKIREKIFLLKDILELLIAGFSPSFWECFWWKASQITTIRFFWTLLPGEKPVVTGMMLASYI